MKLIWDQQNLIRMSFLQCILFAPINEHYPIDSWNGVSASCGFARSRKKRISSRHKTRTSIEVTAMSLGEIF